MGLDIMALSHLEYVGPFSDWPEDDDDGISIHTAFGCPSRLNGKPEGKYRSTPATRVYDFRAGSYSSYGEWRARLARLVLDVDISAIWANPGLYAPMPFAELIDYSDCQGALGPETAGRLGAAFGGLGHDEIAELGPELVRHWRIGCHLARQDGFLVLC